MTRRSILFSSVLATALVAGMGQTLAQEERWPGWGMMMHDMMGRDGPMGRSGMMGMMGGCPMMGANGQAATFIDGRLAFLKAELAVTDAQKAEWDAYAEATKRNLQSMQGMRQTMMAAFDAKTPVERLDSHIAAMESRINSLKDVKPALEKLYGTLSAEQKKKADDILTGMGCMM